MHRKCTCGAFSALEEYPFCELQTQTNVHKMMTILFLHSHTTETVRKFFWFNSRAEKASAVDPLINILLFNQVSTNLDINRP